MDRQEALEFIRGYFAELFVRRNLDVLDEYLSSDYFDEDIGDPTVNHIQNSKEFLREWFEREPSIGVDVIDGMVHDDVITAYLEWFKYSGSVKQSIQKGVAVFVVKGRKIVRRRTFIYEIAPG